MKEFSLRGSLVLATEKDIDRALAIDAPSVTTNTDVYCKSNRLGYFLAINLWLILIKDYSRFGWMFLLKRIISDGLLKTIAGMDAAGDCVAKGEQLTDTLASTIAGDVSRSLIGSIPPRDTEKNIGRDPLATTLFLFRFLKRFSPIGADVLEKNSISGFKEMENRMKLFQRGVIREHKWSNKSLTPYGRDSLTYRGPEGIANFSEHIMCYIREEVCSLNWDSVVKRYSKCGIQDGIFTPGASYEGGSSLLSKLSVLAEQRPEFFYEPMGIPYTGAYPKGNMELLSDGTFRQCVRIIGVPKSYKKARIVAPEEVQRQIMARRLFSIIEDILPPNIDLRNQTRNQDLAWQASVSGEGATLDLTAASDCVTPTLVKLVFPSEVVAILDQLTAKCWTEDKASFRQLQQFSTMGNSLTFVVESIVFWAICQAAVKYCERITGESVNFPISVYGDDCIVPQPWAQTCTEWLEACGFIVNESKSFISADYLYRESCGSEWYQGVDVSTYYWPRRTIEGSFDKGTLRFSPKLRHDGYADEDYDCTSTLVALQHRLYRVSDDAAMFLSACVMEVHPKMTFSSYGSTYGDLWGPEDTSERAWAPITKEGREGIALSEAPEYMVRRLRYVRSEVPTKKAKIDPFKERLLDSYNYRTFLKEGPSYLTDLDRLLGISTAPTSYEQASGQTQAVWSLKKF